jgi:hypothetical protein
MLSSSIPIQGPPALTFPSLGSTAQYSGGAHIHYIPSGQRVLNRVGQRVAQVERARDVGRGDRHHEDPLGVVLDRVVLQNTMHTMPTFTLVQRARTDQHSRQVHSLQATCHGQVLKKERCIAIECAPRTHINCCSQRAVAMTTTAAYRVLWLEEPLLLPPVVPCGLNRRGVVGVKVGLRQICGAGSEQSYHQSVMRATKI